MYKQKVRLEGRFVILEEVEPKYFEYIVKWRNNPELNKFLNQPYKLTMENQTKWYNEVYLKDKTQGLLVMLDKETGTSFGTLGWTDWNEAEAVCISGRLLVGNPDYLGSIHTVEGLLLHSDFMFDVMKCKEMYCHIVDQNKKVISLNKRIGYVKNLGVVKYPKELCVNGLVQSEYIRDKELYLNAKQKVTKLLNL